MSMWDERYAEPGYAYGTEPNDFLRERAQRYLPPGGRVLCLAEGEGRNAVYLARLGYRVTGVDSSPIGLAKARQLAEQSGVQIATVVADLGHHELGEEAWDGIVSIWCHLPPELRAGLHRRVVGALKPGGVLLLEAYRPEQLVYETGGPKAAELMLTLDAARRELAGLELVEAREVVRDVHEGKYHFGQSAVVQVVARKR